MSNSSINPWKACVSFKGARPQAVYECKCLKQVYQHIEQNCETFICVPNALCDKQRLYFETYFQSGDSHCVLHTFIRHNSLKLNMDWYTHIQFCESFLIRAKMTQLLVWDFLMHEAAVSRNTIKQAISFRLHMLVEMLKPLQPIRHSICPKHIKSVINIIILQPL